MVEQLTDPAQICERAVDYVERADHLEGVLGLAAFDSSRPFQDVAQCQPGVWDAFCRASAVAKEMGHWSSWTERRRFLREAAAWLRDHAEAIDVDDELAYIERYPGGFKAILKDPKLHYLGPFTKRTPDEAIEEGRILIQRVRDREAFEAGDDRFEEVHNRVGGVSMSFVRLKEGRTR